MEPLIFVTNDDGIDSQGVRELADSLRGFHVEIHESADRGSVLEKSWTSVGSRRGLGGLGP